LDGIHYEMREREFPTLGRWQITQVNLQPLSALKDAESQLKLFAIFLVQIIFAWFRSKAMSTCVSWVTEVV